MSSLNSSVLFCAIPPGRDGRHPWRTHGCITTPDRPDMEGTSDGRRARARHSSAQSLDAAFWELRLEKRTSVSPWQSRSSRPCGTGGRGGQGRGSVDYVLCRQMWKPCGERATEQKHEARQEWFLVSHQQTAFAVSAVITIWNVRMEVLQHAAGPHPYIGRQVVQSSPLRGAAENGLHGPTCLNVTSPVSGTFWEGFRGVALLRTCAAWAGLEVGEEL